MVLMEMVQCELWCPYLREAGHVDHKELWRLHEYLTQLVKGKLAILRGDCNVVQCT